MSVFKKGVRIGHGATFDESDSDSDDSDREDEEGAEELENQRGKREGGGKGGRGRVPGRTGRRSRCCGFAEVLGSFRAELEGMSIGFRELKMTAWSFRMSLTKWDPLTRPGS